MRAMTGQLLSIGWALDQSVEWDTFPRSELWTYFQLADYVPDHISHLIVF